MVHLSGIMSLKKRDSPSSRSNWLPIVPHLGVGLVPASPLHVGILFELNLYQSYECCLRHCELGYTTALLYSEDSFLLVIQSLLLLQSFGLLFCNALWALGGRAMIYMSYLGLNVSRSLTLCTLTSQGFYVAGHCMRKLFWWELRKELFYGYSTKATQSLSRAVSIWQGHSNRFPFRQTMLLITSAGLSSKLCV